MDEKTKLTVIYTSLAFAGLLLSTIFSLMLTYTPFGFIVLFCLYILGYSIFVFVLNIINRKKTEGDLKTEILTYITLFNMLFTLAMCIFTIVLRDKIKRSACYM